MTGWHDPFWVGIALVISVCFGALVATGWMLLFKLERILIVLRDIRNHFDKEERRWGK